MQDREYEYGYSYTMALCSAIEKLTKIEEERDGGIFVYKGSNLRFALERSLYFSYASSERLFEIYIKWKKGDLPAEIFLYDDVEKGLICLMCNLEDNRVAIAIPTFYGKIKATAEIILRLAILASGTGVLSSWIRKGLNRWHQRRARADVLFYAVNDRFARYMKPIFDRVSAKCAYITESATTEDYLQSKGFSLVKISHFLYSLSRWSRKDSWLDRFCLIEKYDLLYDTIRRLRPRSVALVEGNASSYEVVNQICKKLDISCVCIQQGWSPYIHNGFRNMSFSKMLVWGEGFAKALAPFNPAQRFIATGSHVVNVKYEGRTREKGDKLRIGFLPQMPTRIFGKERFNDFFDLAAWAADEFKDCEVRISEHPTIANTERFYRLAGEQGRLKFMSSKKYPLEEIIGLNDISVSVYSTTILESIAAGALPVIVNLTSMPNYFPNVHAEGAGIEVRSVKEAQEILKKLINNPSEISRYETGMKDFRKLYFAYGKEQAFSNILREIVSP